MRFVGFGLGEDEWVNVRKAVRERSVALEHSECNKVKVGDIVLCFQVLLYSKLFFQNVTNVFSLLIASGPGIH